ncbi:MAG: S24 family peptidase [Bacteroidota bacterium]|nr:S24 family peptidase [Bacteroidota bacterium]
MSNKPKNDSNGSIPLKETMVIPQLPSRSELKKLIKDSGIPISLIAEKIGIVRQNLDWHLRGEKRVKADIYFRIKKAIDEINSVLDHPQSVSSAGAASYIPGNAVSDKSAPLSEHNSTYPSDYMKFKYIYVDKFPILEKFTFINGELDMSENNLIGFSFFCYPNKEKCFAIEATGDQMTDSLSAKSIVPGDILLIDLAEKVISGDIVVAALPEGRYVIRQIILNKDLTILKCFNPKYPDIEIPSSELIHVGKVCKKHGKEIDM